MVGCGICDTASSPYSTMDRASWPSRDRQFWKHVHAPTRRRGTSNAISCRFLTTEYGNSTAKCRLPTGGGGPRRPEPEPITAHACDTNAITAYAAHSPANSRARSRASSKLAAISAIKRLQPSDTAKTTHHALCQRDAAQTTVISSIAHASSSTFPTRRFRQLGRRCCPRTSSPVSADASTAVSRSNQV